MNRLVVYCVFAAVLSTAYSLQAQTSKGTIAGVVTDSTGAAIAGASVAAVDTLGLDNRTVSTASNGEYRVEAVNPSTYRVTVSAPGFSTSKIDNVDVRGSLITSVNVQLEVGAIQQTISVEASAAHIQADSAELSKSVSEKEVTELPVATLNPIELVLTEPGAVTVHTRDNLTNGMGFSVNGLRPRANNFLIDGFDNNDNGVAGQALQPQNLQAVKEVSVLTNSYAPEYGRGGASVTNVIYKGGTNQYHGAVWELYSGAGLNAIAAEQHRQALTSVPQFVNNVYGFSVGGPIVKNKLFLFGTSQWNHFNGASTGQQITIPTAAGVSSLQSLGPNQNVDILLHSLGGLTAPVDPATVSSINIGNRPGCASPCLIQVGNELRSPKSIQRSYEYDVRGDYNASEKDTFTTRYIGTQQTSGPDLFANPNSLPGVDTQQGGPARNLGVNWTHVYNPRMLNELRFTAQTIDATFGPTAKTSANPYVNLPDIEVGGLSNVDFGGLNSAFPQGRGHSVYQYQDAFSWAAGNHNLKMGADLVHLGIADVIPFNSRGALNFNDGGDCSAMGLATCTALANYLDNFTGPGGAASKQFGNPLVNDTQTQHAYYFQDAWKMRQNITLTYGVRYEYQGTPFNALQYPTVNEFTAAFDQFPLRTTQKPDKNNFGPRAGIAYTPRLWQSVFGQDKTVIRAGFGTFYDALFTNIQNNTAASSPNATGGTLIDPGVGRGTSGAVQLVPSVTSSLSPVNSVSTAVSNLVNPMTYQWNVNIERQLPGNTLLTVAYVGTRGERLFVNEQLNPKIDGVRLNPNRGSINARTNHGDSIYHGLQIDANRRFRNGLLFRGAYTWSRSIDNASEVFATSGGSSFPQDLFSFRGDRGLSAFNRSQRAVFTWIYQIPSIRGSSTAMAALHAVSRDWQVAGTAAFESGAPETIHFEGFDQNRDGSSFNDRPSAGNNRAPINYGPDCLSSTTCITGIGQLNPDGSYSDFNTGAAGAANQFRYIVTPGKAGNLGRNTIVNPGRQDYTLAVSRRFKIPVPHLEGQELEFRAEGLNPFNHANAGGGTNILGVSGDILSPNFLNVANTVEGGRVLRLWLKYNF